MRMMIQYKMIVLLFISLCLVLPFTQATDVKYCGKKDYPVKVKGVDIVPNPVVRGKPATFSISATTSEPISEGILRVDVRYFSIHVYGENHNLCEETSCPVATGDFVVSHSQLLPGFTPPGRYSLTMKMTDAEGSELTCISFDFNIGFGSSVADS